MAYKDPEKQREYWHEWVKRNPEKRRKSKREWAKRNPEKIREENNKHTREWRKRNPEKHHEAKRKWAKRNPEKIREKNRKFCEHLKDGYVRAKLSEGTQVPQSQWPPDIVELKRAHVMLTREIMRIQKQGRE